MWICTDWSVNWDAIAAVGTLLAVMVALGTTAFLEFKADRRRRIEVRSMAAALYWEFETNRKSLLVEIATLDATPKQAALEAAPAIPGTNGRYSRLPLLRIAEGLRRSRFSVLKNFASRIALFEEPDAISLGALVAAVWAFQENQDIEPEGIFSMDDDHARGTEDSMRTWALNIANLLEPAANRMAVIARVKDR